jgi:hypothetical protein
MQMYRIFLAHLTTTIVKLDIYLRQNKNARSLPIDLKCFERLQEEVHKSKSKKSQDDQKRPKLSDKHQQMLNDFLNALKWTREDFISDYRVAYTIINEKTIDREKRLDILTLIRILVCSGLPRNPDSVNRNRDWGKIALVAVLESAIVASYRETLFAKCPSAHRLRRDLSTFLFKHNTGLQQLTSNLALKRMTTWIFPDGIKVQTDTPEERMDFGDHMSLISEWKKSCNIEDSIKNDPIAKVIHSLESNKYLACSSADAVQGSVESLAHNFISGLMKVCLNLSPLRTYINLTSLIQIMYQNKARLDFNKDNDDDQYDFVMSDVSIPDIPRRPHAVSTTYRDPVSRQIISIRVILTLGDVSCSLAMMNGPFLPLRSPCQMRNRQQYVPTSNLLIPHSFLLPIGRCAG